LIIEDALMRRLRISAISYLNTAPLMWDFEHGDAVADFDLSYTTPSACAAALSAGTADIGIIPAAAYTTIPNLLIVPGVAIASRKAVRSILLISKIPLERVRTVALDSSSITSIALTKILFEKWLGGKRHYANMEPNLDHMLEQHDAALVIGDTALKVDRSRYLTLDLAQDWRERTGKPFVFAFWVVRRMALQDGTSIDLANTFQKSRDHGLQRNNLALTAHAWAPRLEISESEIHTYLTENIHFYLDAECLGGLHLFYQYAGECGVLPSAPPLQFLDVRNPEAARLVGT
jgi:chorismate dehydratase